MNKKFMNVVYAIILSLLCSCITKKSVYYEGPYYKVTPENNSLLSRMQICEAEGKIWKNEKCSDQKLNLTSSNSCSNDLQTWDGNACVDKEVPKNLYRLCIDPYIEESDLRTINILRISFGLQSCFHLNNFLNLVERLNLIGEELVSIRPLYGLKNIVSLNLEKNDISDISSLSSLTNLEDLFLRDNKIDDLSPLRNLEFLKHLVVDEAKIDLNDPSKCPSGAKSKILSNLCSQ